MKVLLCVSCVLDHQNRDQDPRGVRPMIDGNYSWDSQIVSNSSHSITIVRGNFGNKVIFKFMGEDCEKDRGGDPKRRCSDAFPVSPVQGNWTV